MHVPHIPGTGLAATNAKKEFQLTDKDLRGVERVDKSRWGDARFIDCSIRGLRHPQKCCKFGIAAAVVICNTQHTLHCTVSATLLTALQGLPGHCPHPCLNWPDPRCPGQARQRARHGGGGAGEGSQAGASGGQQAGGGGGAAPSAGGGGWTG